MNPWDQDDETPPPNLIKALFGMDLTPEQRQQAKEGQMKNTATGNLAYEALPAFRLHRQCPKCGEARKTPNTRYVATDECLKETGDHDALCRQCRGCGYVWFERTIDGETP